MIRTAGVALALSLSVSCSGPSNTQDEAGLRTRPVDRPGHSQTPTRNAAGKTLEYFGGPVIPNAKVYVVWWGNPANLNPAITAAHGGIADFYAGVLNSNFIDWLNEYDTNIAAQAGSHSGSAGTNQRIGRGNYAGTLTLTNIPSGNVTDAQIQSTLDQAFAAGTLPPPDENTIYAIYFPSSVSISLGGSGSCLSFGAYHEAIVETARHNAYYLVMPDCGDSFSGTTIVSAHELVEAITDGQPTPGSNPDYPQAWNDSSGSESGDLCQSSSGTVNTPLGTFTVQGIWDERSQGCKVITNAPQDFNIALSPNTATINQGASATFQVQSATVAGAAQTLTLSVTAPAGATATISPATITSGQSATLTVTATNAGAARQVIVRADGVAGDSHTAALLLSTPGTASPDFALGASPASQTAAPGGSASYAVKATASGGFNGSVALSIAGLPSGGHASFNGDPLSSAGASLAVTTDSNIATGSYPLTITGSSGALSHTAQVTLAIASGGLATQVTSPAPGATVSGAVNVTATATGAANKLELYVDGALLATGSGSPFSASWDTTKAANGAHSLTSKAYDAGGNTASSAAVSVTVNNGTTTTCPPGTTDVGGVCVPTGGCNQAAPAGPVAGLFALLLGAAALARRRRG